MTFDPPEREKRRGRELTALWLVRGHRWNYMYMYITQKEGEPGNKAR